MSCFARCPLLQCVCVRRRHAVRSNGRHIIFIYGTGTLRVCLFAATQNIVLSEGRLSGFQVNCPLHGASFDVRDGTHSGPPAYTGVRCFEIVEDDSGVSVKIENGKPEAEDGPQTGFFQTR